MTDVATTNPSCGVGVVMTAYNSRPFIGKALRSLRAQTMTDWECVVVDDGSTDTTAEAVERIARQDARIKLLRHPPGGVSKARNVGLAELSDSVAYVALLDSDDCYLPDALESLVAALESRPDAVGVFGHAEYIDKDGRPLRPGQHSALQRSRRVVRRLGLRDVEPAADSTFADLCVTGAIWPSAVGLHRRWVIEAVGAFDPSFTRQGDWELYLRMSRYGPFPVLNKQVVWYRLHGSNLTGDVVESSYQRDRVRRKAWTATTNTPAQRQIVAQGARRVQLVDIRRTVHRLADNLKAGRSRSAARNAASLLIMMANLVRRGPARPSLRRVQWTREQNQHNARP